ncbi:hypothetical protein LZK76_36380 (plasmid) [Rhizobium leguminosarum]|nr:hypothetical protein LZK76_36380 [Rhizobium leguminosarum]
MALSQLHQFIIINRETKTDLIDQCRKVGELPPPEATSFELMQLDQDELGRSAA